MLFLLFLALGPIVKKSDSRDGRRAAWHQARPRVERPWRATTPSDACRRHALYCDLTQSWSAKGGGVGTYIRHKRRHILDQTPHRHLLIIPGARDRRWSRRTAARSPSPSPRRACREAPITGCCCATARCARRWREHRPDLIECQDAYNLPWAAIAPPPRLPGDRAGRGLLHRFSDRLCRAAVDAMARRGGRRRRRRGFATLYAGSLYRRFDAMFAMSENGGAAKLRALGVGRVESSRWASNWASSARPSAARACAPRSASATTSR